MSVLAASVSMFGKALPATRSNRLLILIYHRVRARPDPMFPGEVDAARFEWQMALIRRYCTPVPLADGVEGMRRGRLPPRAVAVTFDDGYSDNALVALPILQRYQIAATFFIATGFLDGGRMWNDSIIESIRRTRLKSIELTDFGLSRVRLGSAIVRGQLAERLIGGLKHLPPGVRQQRTDELAARAAVDLPRDLMMTSGQVQSLAAAGMQIGAHTVTHPILRLLPDDAARAEIEDGRRTLAAITGAAITAFAYPNGRPGEDYSERDRRLVESLGFHLALSTRWGAATSASDIFQLPRFTPWDRGQAQWLTRLLLSYRSAA